MKENKDFEVHSDKEGVENFQKAMEAEVVDAEIVEPDNVSVESEMTDEEALGNMPTNIPYKKIYNDEGELANPITKADPYLTPFLNRRQKKALIRQATRHPKNNKKGIRLIVTPFAKGKFVKTHIEKQFIPEHILEISDDETGEILETRFNKARTIIHNKMQLRNE